MFDFANAIGPFCNTGIMVLPETTTQSPGIVQALCNGFQQAMHRVYTDPAYAKAVARKEFPELSGDVVDRAIDAELQYRIPSQSLRGRPHAMGKSYPDADLPEKHQRY